MVGILQSIESPAGQTIGLIRENGQVEDCSLVDPATLGGGAVLPFVVYVSLTAAPGGDGSIGSPFDTLQAAADALGLLLPVPGGVVMVAPGDYSLQVLSWPDDVAITWQSTASLLQVIQGFGADPNAPRFPAASLSASGNPGVTQSFQGLNLTGALTLTNSAMASFVGCIGVNVSGAQLLMVQGGQLVNSDVAIATVVLQGVDLFNAVINANSFVYLLDCNSWGQTISVGFPAGPPGPTCFYDPATKGNASAAPPSVSNGVALFLGLPIQSITGVTTQQQVDSLVTALVNLGVATDDR